MVSNFLIGYPSIPLFADDATTTHTATDKPVENLFAGTKEFELDAETSDHLTVDVDNGVGVTKSANFVAVKRAKLLAGRGCTGIRLRGSTQSAFLPSTLSPILHLDPNRGVTTVSGAVSAWEDQSGNNNDASQGTAGSRPLLSRADNQENHLKYSEALSTSPWAAGGLTAAAVATPNPIDSGSGVWTITENGAAGEHYVGQTPTEVIIPSGTAARFSCYAKAVASSREYCVRIWGNVIDGYTVVSLIDGSVLVAGTGKTTTVTDVGGGWYYISTAFTTTSAAATNIRLQLYKIGTGVSYTGDSAGAIAIYAPQLRVAAADSTYVKSEAFAQIRGINGNKALVSDGTDDYLLANSVAASVTGTDKAYTIFVVAECFSSAATSKSLVSFGRTSTATPYIVHRYFSTTLDSAMRDDASTSANPSYSGMSPPNLEVVTIKTTGTSLTIYKNGTAISSQAFDVGATTLDTFSIGSFYRNGAPIASNYFVGKMGDVLVFNSALSDTDRQAVEAYLTTKYSTTPLLQIDQLEENLNGPNEEDYIQYFTESSAFRYWWLEFVNEGTATLYPMAKAYFGKALDLGRDPRRPVAISCAKENPWSANAANSGTLTFDPVNDTAKELFLDEVAKYRDVMPVALIDRASLVFPHCGSMFATILQNEFVADYGADNILTLSFKEQI